MKRIPFSIFPKQLKQLAPEALVDTVVAAGLDTTNVVIRDGFGVSPGKLREELPSFLGILRDRGLEVTFATAGFDLAALAADPTPLAVLAEHGIAAARIGYVPKGDDPAALVDQARRQLASIAEHCLAHGIKAVYQVHHGHPVASASMAWQLVRELDPRAVGVMLDPGNQQFEGWEDPFHQARLLGPHLAALGIKDVVIERDPARAGEPGKGWRKTWASCAEGVVDWHRVFAACHAAGFAGTFVLMPFYHSDPAALPAHIATMSAEVTYLRGVMATLWPEHARPALGTASA